MNKNYFLPGGIYYCHRCGYFFDDQSNNLVDLPYSELPAELALHAMQVRTESLIFCHMRQRGKLKSKEGKAVIHLNYRGCRIDCWRELDSSCKSSGRESMIWFYIVDGIDSKEDVKSGHPTIFEAIADAKEYVDFLIAETDLVNPF